MHIYLRMYKPKHSAAFPPSASERLSHMCCSKWCCMMAKRIFDDAMRKMRVRKAYDGSRKEAARWEYSEETGAGFAELHPDHTPTDEEFFNMLQQVPDVTHVEWNSSKTSQGNPSKNHHMERNILVTSSRGPGSASHPLEFELTRNQHMKDKRLPFTVTACFKEPSPDLVPEAWRILAEVVKGRELFPAHIARYRAKVLGLAS